MILHLGLGAFFRAQLADYTQDAGGWRIEPVGMRSDRLVRAMRDAEGYGVILRAPDGPRLKRITCCTRPWHLPTEAEALVSRFADPEVRIVSLTITEKGYGAALSERRLDPEADVIAADLAAANPPQGAIGLIVAGLAARRAAGRGGLTLMSCDNLPDNGGLLAALVGEFAERRDPDLARWIAETCTFPASMVDRITPATTEATLAEAGALGGAPDPLAVETEPFRQWVIEDRFAGPRPAWEDAGAEFVADVAPYEDMKLRMLNGAHSLLAYLGCLAGLEAVRDVMAHPVAALVDRHMAAAARTVSPDLDTDAYRAALLDRFANPAIRHLCRQIASDGSQKLPQRLLAPAGIALQAGESLDTYALAVAAWLRFVAREGLDVADPLAARLAALPAGYPDRLDAVAAIFGPDHAKLFAAPTFRTAVFDADRLLESQPPEAWSGCASN
ncbi:mannitol dehydrogenase family protein [Pseudaestuariivita atlantica]|uniref:mannitol dehydrogenase family protein n=1 Tax=Pseudaestuariivita atlantica TaxID=1317121 RepID=UPI001A94E1F7|nr:mannitol dehydrogenase family protein [Pseudaestuariivita atlantica]